MRTITGGIVTTPEKQRFREFLFIGLVGLAMATFIGLSFYQNHHDAVRERESKAREDRQTALFQKCITDVVGDLVDALTTRSSVTTKDANSVTTLISEIFAANGNQAKALKAVDKYNKTQAEVAQTRKDSPFPPFPDGKCDFTEGASP
jgi:hypothetical protein